MADREKFIEARNKVFGGLAFVQNEVCSFFEIPHQAEISRSLSDENIKRENKTVCAILNVDYNLESSEQNSMIDSNLLLEKIDYLADLITKTDYLYYFKDDGYNGNVRYNFNGEDGGIEFRFTSSIDSDKWKDVRLKAEKILDNAFDTVLNDKNKVILEEKDFVDGINKEIQKAYLKEIRLYLVEDKLNHIKPCFKDSFNNVFEFENPDKNIKKEHLANLMQYVESIDIKTGAEFFSNFAETNQIGKNVKLHYEGKEYNLDSLHDMLEAGKKDRLDNRLRSPRYKGKVSDLVFKKEKEQGIKENTIKFFDQLTSKQQSLLNKLDIDFDKWKLKHPEEGKKIDAEINDAVSKSKSGKEALNVVISKMKEIGVYKTKFVAKKKPVEKTIDKENGQSLQV